MFARVASPAFVLARAFAAHGVRMGSLCPQPAARLATTRLLLRCLQHPDVGVALIRRRRLPLLGA